MIKKCYDCGHRKDVYRNINYYRKICQDCYDKRESNRKIRNKINLVRKAKEFLHNRNCHLNNDEEYVKLYSKIKRIEKKYNLPYEEYINLSNQQNGLCAICKTIEIQVVDHCHTTGKVRGLLCGRCNTGIGLFLDNVESLKNAIDYLCR